MIMAPAFGGSRALSPSARAVRKVKVKVKVKVRRKERAPREIHRNVRGQSSPSPPESWEWEPPSSSSSSSSSPRLPEPEHRKRRGSGTENGSGNGVNGADEGRGTKDLRQALGNLRKDFFRKKEQSEEEEPKRNVQEQGEDGSNKLAGIGVGIGGTCAVVGVMISFLTAVCNAWARPLVSVE